MNDTIYVTPEGQAANKDILKNFIEAFNEVWEKIKISFIKAMKWMKKVFGIFFRLPGYKRLAKARQLAYYESVSSGKSNNWRKVYGLYLARNNC